jgi:hypothetical protein
MAAFSLVHGAWHGGWCWDPLRAELEAPPVPARACAPGVQAPPAGSPMLECPRELADLLDALLY